MGRLRRRGADGLELDADFESEDEDVDEVSHTEFLKSHRSLESRYLSQHPNGNELLPISRESRSVFLTFT